jgi:hypothetical protein
MLVDLSLFLTVYQPCIYPPLTFIFSERVPASLIKCLQSSPCQFMTPFQILPINTFKQNPDPVGPGRFESDPVPDPDQMLPVQY